MCFAELEDLTGKIECIVFPKVFEEFEAIIDSSEPKIIEGYINLSEEPRKIFPQKIQALGDSAQESVTQVRVNLELENLSERRIMELKKLVLSFRGNVPLHVVVKSEQGRARLPLGEEFKVDPSPQMAAEINQVFKTEAVKFIVNGAAQKPH